MNLLRSGDHAGLIGLSKKDRSVMRILLALTYDKKALLSRRAIEAIGEITSSMPPEEARQVIQRVLWMMREESGGCAWSGPEILGEIVRGNPKPFEDIVPIIASFYEEEIFKSGVIRALERIAEVRPGLARPHLNRLSTAPAGTASRRS